MTAKLKVLHVALATQNYDLAAHAIVYGMIAAKVKERQNNGKKGSPQEKPKRT